MGLILDPNIISITWILIKAIMILVISCFCPVNYIVGIIFLINGFEGNKGVVSLNFEIIPNGYGIHQYPFTMMEHLCETMKAINYWVNLKATMDHSKYYEDQGVI